MSLPRLSASQGKGMGPGRLAKPSRTEGQRWHSSSSECTAHSLAGPLRKPWQRWIWDLSVQQQQTLLGAFWGFLHSTKVPSLPSFHAQGSQSNWRQELGTLSPGQGTKARSEKDRKDLSQWQQMSAMLKCCDSVLTHPSRQCNQVSMTDLQQRWPGPGFTAGQDPQWQQGVACPCPHQGLGSAV